MKLASCDGKAWFETRAQAVAVLTRWHRDQRTYRVTFHCGHCGKWHLGSINTPRRRAVRRLRLLDAAD